MQNQQQQHHQDYSKERSLPPSPPRDSFSPSHVVDIDAIELEKENIQPIRQGRSAQVLSRLFSTQPVDRAHELALQHQRFQAELDRIDELKDPLDAYMRYVSWTIENYPQSGAQGHDSRLVSLLEQAIETFKDEERYRNDPRYVKLLILYSEKIEFPMDVFSFMETNKIGNEIAMFYEEHADYLESQEE
ncbi:Mad3/BUB1 homology region 1-domain-containing protein [Lobosporangium transversale]|uniref:Mad3/BUB1 homology region 1-domain-containing protein n=1 Tax=Lobosporangium transversale TaxID=64571 RepID=A0A1Y2GBD4_9FUNG|nr:Mad3/BUB1 homology region 1-domain-containing protein [Lobosporangium transversale]ORZ06296.1 Mad3/BUB1 homology region 1-domain-containing protein [Lobosporangium transversale]|eukprot:XP_021877459.1 Mad3/BUB1 homology region 1-domain-containing protein [Lobosporangium transversale]